MHVICHTFTLSYLLPPTGAIDVEELQYALEVMGVKKSEAEVQELMDSVDKDGSGEFERGALGRKGKGR